jgi:serine/threonine protein kinase
MGTSGYCAPEQDEIFCKKLTAAYGAHTDLFAIGQIYYELLLGENQRFGEHYVADLKEKVWTQRPSLPEKLLALPDGHQIDALLNKMTTFNPDKRKYDISYERALATLKPKRR